MGRRDCPATRRCRSSRSSADDAKELAAQVLAHMQKPSGESGEIGLIGEGNPLFIEELAASVAENDERVRRSCRRRSAASSRRVSMRCRPTSARCCSTRPSSERSSGRARSKRMSSGRLDLAELLDSLEGRDFIRREPVSRLRGDQQFSFKHDLIRDAAYATLPRPQRRKRHAQVAAFLEESTSEIAAAASALAQHWREAGEDATGGATTSPSPRDQAGRGWAKEEAVGFYQPGAGSHR